jgi:uncharacterized protein
VPVTWENLVARLDEEGIDRAVLLPIADSPEAMSFPGLFTSQRDMLGQIETALKNPRLIAFGGLDPRMGGNTTRTDFGWVLERFVRMGCVGIGEVVCNLDADDARVVNMFRQCGDWQLPVIIHSTGRVEGAYGLIDEPGAPLLARLLEQIPQTTLIAHGPGIWAEVSSALTVADKNVYPKGPVVGEGALLRLLRTFPNFYADISAGSGYNALTRDEAFGVRFLNEYQDKLVFGTDVCFGDAKGRMGHLPYLKRLVSEGRLSQEAFAKITSGNALRLLARYRA